MRKLKEFFRPTERNSKATLFQGFWHGPALGPLRQACLASFIAQGHRFDLYTYAPVAVPSGINLRNAAEIIPLSDVFYYDNPLSGKPDIGPYSDLFRFKLLSERGGWWSDVDAICLSPDIPVVGRAWAQEIPERRAGAVGTSQIAFAAGDSVVLELYRRCLELSKTGFPRRESLGPDLITNVVRERGLPTDVFGTSDTFYPIRWIEMFKLWLPQFTDEITTRAQKSLFMPVYASFPQYIGLDLGKLPPPGSFLFDICEKYLPNRAGLAHYSAEDIIKGTRAFLAQNEWATDELEAVAGPEVLRQLGIGTRIAPYHGRRRPSTQITKLDDRQIDFKPDDILCVIGVRNELQRLPYFLEYHRKLGVDRFLFLDNGSDDGTTDYLLAQDDCHCFHTEGSHFALNTDPPSWSNAVLNTYCDGHWCVVVDGDELLVYPGSEHVALPDFCNLLSTAGADAMAAYMIDMYADGPASQFSYRQGQPFTEAAPYFDPKPGWLKSVSSHCPPVQMFGGVRERLFWRGRFKQTMPPCLSKVPLVKWQRGMRYLVAQHFINKANLAQVTGAILHFKFLTGFQVRSEIEISENSEIEEKGLQERKVYLDALTKEPDLAFRNSESVKYAGSQQLTDLGWIRSSAPLDFLRSGTVTGHVIATKPVIIYGRAFFDVLGPAAALSPYLKGRRAFFLVSNSWTWEDDQRVKQAADAYFRHVERYPEHDVTFVCNTQAEVELMQRRGIKAHYANQNMFVNENIFKVLPEVPKTYDAVYNARITPFKRHNLCAAIESLALIYYFMDEKDASYLENVRSALPRAAYINGGPGDYRWLSLADVTRTVNACHVGLCLSDTEGAMKACMEYQLCGLPVVTTPNKGGRNEFLDDEIAITAPADPDSIAEAVRELISRKLEPHYVREKTLRAIEAEREKFLDFIQGILDREHAGWNIREHWSQIYVNNLLKWRVPAEEFLRDAKLL